MRKKLSPLLLPIVCIASLGGLLFGYTTSVIAPALLFIQSEFPMSAAKQGFLVSIALIGALFGASVGGFFADRLGRKLTIIISGVLFVIASLLLFLAGSVLGLLMGRLLIGFAVGLSSVVVPLYIAEMAPPRIRGAMVAANQLAITIGILLAYLLGYAFSSSENWRLLFALSLFPALLQIVGLLFLPETPSYLMSKGKVQQAKKVQEKVSTNGTEVLHDTSEKKLRFSALFKPPYLAALLIGLGVSLIQQVTGINVVIYYAPQIFTLAGVSSTKAALLATVGVGSVNVVATILSLYLLDRAGRRRLLLFGLIGMILALFALSFAFMTDLPAISFISIISLMVYVVSFALSLGPVTWVFISEIYPLKVRGRAMGVATFVNWLSNIAVSFTFLSLVGQITVGGTFLLYAIIGILGYLFVYYKVPETKGKTLDEISQFWRRS